MHRENAAVRHRLHGVRAKIHDDLMKLRRLADHGDVAGFELALETHGTRERRSEKLERLSDYRLHVHRRTVAHAAAAEREDSLDERLRTRPRMHHVVDIAAQIASVRRRLLRHFAITQNRAEYVVEVVRDAAGERADGFHFLRFPQSLFALLDPP